MRIEIMKRYLTVLFLAMLPLALHAVDCLSYVSARAHLRRSPLIQWCGK
jgi:hypothetical protein